MATGKAKEIADEFNSIIMSTEWWEVLQSWPRGLERQRLALLSASIVLNHAAGTLSKELKFKLFTLSTSPPDMECQMRKDTCFELLAGRIAL